MKPLARQLWGILPASLQQRVANLEAPIARRLARGVLWSATGSVLSRALNIVATIVIARLLGEVEYGHVGMIQSTVDLFNAFAGIGLSYTATKHIAELHQLDRARTGRIIAMTSVVSWLSGGVIALTLMIGAPWLAETTLHAPELTSLLRVGAWILLFGVINSAQSGVLSGFEAFDVKARVTVVGAAANVLLTIVGVILGGAMGMVYGLVLGAAALCAMNAIAIHRQLRKVRIDVSIGSWWQEARLVATFGLPAMASSLIIAPVHWACNTMLVRTPGGFAELGIYNATNQWFNSILFLPSVVSVVSIPLLSSLIGQGQWADVRRVTWKSVRLNALVLAPVIVMAALSPWIMPLYGPGFAGSEFVLALNLASAFLVVLFTPIWPMLLAAGKTRAVLFMNVGWSAILLGLTYVLVPYGALGMVIARFVAYVFHVGWMFSYARHVLIANTRRGLP